MVYPLNLVSELDLPKQLACSRVSGNSLMRLLLGLEPLLANSVASVV